MKQVNDFSFATSFAEKQIESVNKIGTLEPCIQESRECKNLFIFQEFGFGMTIVAVTIVWVSGNLSLISSKKSSLLKSF